MRVCERIESAALKVVKQFLLHGRSVAELRKRPLAQRVHNVGSCDLEEQIGVWRSLVAPLLWGKSYTDERRETNVSRLGYLAKRS